MKTSIHCQENCDISSVPQPGHRFQVTATHHQSEVTMYFPGLFVMKIRWHGSTELLGFNRNLAVFKSFVEDVYEVPNMLIHLVNRDMVGVLLGVVEHDAEGGQGGVIRSSSLDQLI